MQPNCPVRLSVAPSWCCTTPPNCAGWNVLRQEFVANVSHELKTPLSVIKACIETVLDGAADDPEYRQKFLQRVSDQADLLHALILDMLSLARIESGTEVFTFEDLPLAPLVADCLERHRDRASAKNLRLEMDQGAGTGIEPPAGSTQKLDLSVWADVEAVRQIVDNLVDNAVKYTPDGRAYEGDAGGGKTIRCISKLRIPASASRPQTCSAFSNVSTALTGGRSRELGGTGLGLSIVKHLVQAMHGHVRATSQPG